MVVQCCTGTVLDTMGDLGGCGLTEYKPMLQVVWRLYSGVSGIPAVGAS